MRLFLHRTSAYLNKYSAAIQLPLVNLDERQWCRELTKHVDQVCILMKKMRVLVLTVSIIMFAVVVSTNLKGLRPTWHNPPTLKYEQIQSYEKMDNLSGV